VDARTKRLVQRVQPGEIAVIDHEDLDGVSAEALVAAGVGGVVNAARSISGRYPNLGPIRLLEAGIPLVDPSGSSRQGAGGRAAAADGDRIYAGAPVGVDPIESGDDRGSWRKRSSGLLSASNPSLGFVDYMQRARFPFGVRVPCDRHDLAHRPWSWSAATTGRTSPCFARTSGTCGRSCSASTAAPMP
jgi:hypothetical protein